MSFSLAELAAIREQFPVLGREVHGQPLAYLDNAATTQKPRAVLDALTRYYSVSNANGHRGVHRLSQEATEAYEAARAGIARHLGAPSPTSILFTRGATEAVNLVANTFGQRLGEGDRVLVSHMEHHSNIVPWQMLRDRSGVALDVAPVTDSGELDLEALEALLTPRTRLISLVHVSNTLGTINPVREVIALARARGIAVLLDGAQALAHEAVDVGELGVDFYVTSAHKVYGPTGIGALYVRPDLLAELPPWQGGGDMILSVTFERTLYAEGPQRFEAGTPNIAGAIGFAAALDWLHEIGVERVAAHEESLRAYATPRLLEIPGLRIVGTAPRKAGVLSFVMDSAHPHDIGTIVDQRGVAIRTGHHCTQPLMQRMGVPATARASFAAYNSSEDVDRLVDALRYVHEVFS